MKRLPHFTVIFSLLIFGACNSDDNTVPSSEVCDFMVEISASEYEAATTSNYTIVDAQINQDCLIIQISSSGCDGESWVVQLFDSGAIAESFPEQRFIALDLTNEEECDAVISRTYSFELTLLRISESGEIILNLNSWEGGISYVY